MYLRIQIVLFLSFFAGASFAADAPATAVATAHYVSDLLVYLSQSVDQCFNPSHPQGNAQAKQLFSELAIKASSAAVDIQKQDRPRMTQDLAILQNDLQSFSRSPGFPASLYCATRRACLEVGFSASASYAGCLPVKGDYHGNPQFLAFEHLLDQAFPQLLNDLRGFTSLP
jgi:hypothetical protein